MKKALIVFAALALAAAAYAPFMRAYARRMLAPLPKTLAEPVQTAYGEGFAPESKRFLHAVNTVYRAAKKDARFPGFEIDLSRAPDGTLLAAHDQSALPYAVTLTDIFSALKNPSQKTYWIDLKTELTPRDLPYLLAAARRFHIAPERLMFETDAGETLRLLKESGFSVLLKMPDGFEQDGGDPARRARLNQRLEELLKEYRPQAVAASLGKYAYLRAYFPNLKKAIYYSSTKRPSLKKTYLAQEFEKDPSVIIFMTDEYNF